MNLHLDARQRAMLQEMGVTVWSRSAALDDTPARAPARAPIAPAPPIASLPSVPAAIRPAEGRAAPAPALPGDIAPSPGGSATLRLHPARVLYPLADPAQAPAALGAGWLVVAESPTPADPLAGDAGRLLDAMLRAMRLHQHPRVYLAALERTAHGADAGAAHDGRDATAAALAALVAQVRPSMVLLLGHVAARAALGRTEPLGRLRAEPHQLAGCPAVVTYDPAFLLRAQDNKAAAWADLCRALATVRRSG